MLFFGGCSAFVTGSFFEVVEEAFETELDDADDGITSTTADVSAAGGFAMFVAILLYLGAGLARVALKTSLALLVLAMPMVIGLVVVDTTSLFAAVYYLAIVLVGTGVVLMAIAYIRSRRAPATRVWSKPTFPIWLNIPLSKSSAFFKPLSICETLAVGMAIITP